jgi:adenylate kinase family enzyme
MVKNPLPDLSRVVVVGSSSAGKSTFARDLGACLGSDSFELDHLSWLPDWQLRDREAFRALVAERTREETWVTDGNYRAVRDLIWPRATAIIWLNYAFPLVLWRSVRRTLRRAATREEICNGNIESWRKMVSRDSILLWVITTYHRRKREYRSLFDGDDYPEIAKIELASPAAAKAFLARIEKR